MRRSILVTLMVILCLSAAGFVYMRHSPWMHSHFNSLAENVGEHSVNPVPDSMRKQKYYRAVLNKAVDSIVVIKQLREMYVYHEAHLQKIYRVALGDAPIGHKHFQGDEKTPEGLYHIDGKNPNSSCHKNLGISYPNDADRAYATQYGKSTGGDIKIHGIVNGQGYIGKAHIMHDWTNGCVAVTDDEIDELYKYASMGIPILILP